jgi:[protein-PII] uridylyltransferase
MSKPSPPRASALLDASTLQQALSAAMAAADPRGAVRALLTQTLEQARAAARQRFEQDGGGVRTARLLAGISDVVIRASFECAHAFAQRAHPVPAGERLALLAVGGYGRGELAFHSDVDLLFLTEGPDPALSAGGVKVVEDVLYFLWDARQKVGHAVRTPAECLHAAQADHTIASALLDARFLAGDAALAHGLLQRFHAETARQDHAGYIAAKLSERDRRHLKVGRTRYLVEPNVKDGKGGLRDLHLLHWLAKHLHGPVAAEEAGAGPAAVADLVRRGLLTRSEAFAFAQAAEFLWSVRLHLHLLTDRAEERLTFDLQPELAQRLGFQDRTGQPAVERLMKRYFLAAKQVGGLTRIICAKLEAENCKPAPSLSGAAEGAALPLADPHFRLDAGRLALAEPDLFAHAPHQILRLFALAAAHDRDIHPNALAAAARNLGKVNAQLRRDAQARASFLEAATAARNPAAVLRLMNETGVLGRFVPEFGRIVAKTQFNMYHRYTVDEHTLRAVEILSRLEQGLLAESHPLATQVFPKIINRRALYLAMLLHDVGKSGGDQSEEGAAGAEAAARRLGLPSEEAALIVWLVRHHLIMSETAQRRDLSDPRTVADFASQVGNLERLRLLLVLTVADIRAVGPGVWNGWKGQLLRDLHRAAEAVLRGGRTDEAATAAQLHALAAQCRAALLDRLGPRTAPVESWLAALDDAYWLSNAAEDVLWHAAEAARAEGAAYVAARPAPERGVTQALVRAPDRPGLFAALTGELAALGADIVDARAHTFSSGEIFDVFSLQDPSGGPFGAHDPARLQQLCRRLHARLEGGTPAPPTPAPIPRRLAVFDVAPWVRIDNDASAAATVLELSGRDRPGLLAALAQVLTQSGCSILSAHLGAFGERVSDVFYVQNAEGEKLRDPEANAALVAKLEMVLRDPPEARSPRPSRRLAAAPASTAR